METKLTPEWYRVCDALSVAPDMGQALPKIKHLQKRSKERDAFAARVAELEAALRECAEAFALPDNHENLMRQTYAMIRACAALAKGTA